MATIINNPDRGVSGDSGGWIIGAVIAVIVIILLFVYAIPALRGNQDNNTGTTSAPDQINVNVRPSDGATTNPSGNTGAATTNTPSTNAPATNAPATNGY